MYVIRINLYDAHLTVTMFVSNMRDLFCLLCQGCRVRDHIVTAVQTEVNGSGEIDLSKSPQNRVYDDLLSHRDIVCVPYQRLTDARYCVSYFCTGLGACVRGGLVWWIGFNSVGLYTFSSSDIDTCMFNNTNPLTDELVCLYYIFY